MIRFEITKARNLQCARIQNTRPDIAKIFEYRRSHELEKVTISEFASHKTHRQRTTIRHVTARSARHKFLHKWRTYCPFWEFTYTFIMQMPSNAAIFSLYWALPAKLRGRQKRRRDGLYWSCVRALLHIQRNYQETISTKLA